MTNLFHKTNFFTSFVQITLIYGTSECASSLEVVLKNTFNRRALTNKAFEQLTKLTVLLIKY